MKELKQAGILLIVGIIIILAREYEFKHRASASPEIQGQAELIRVIDGDTIVVNIDGKEEKIRIIGIDTPESVKPNTPVECFAQEATQEITDFLAKPGILSISTDPTQDSRDNYGRLLAHVFMNEINIGEHMIRDGYAYEYTYRDPYIYQLEYRAAEKEARINKRGLWSADSCNGKTA